MVAFATTAELGVRMNRTFLPGEQAWVTALLDDAAAIIRGEIGFPVYPSQTSTYLVYPVFGRVPLPPLTTAITTVAPTNGSTVTWSRFEDTLCVSCNTPMNITVTYGLATVPADLKAINCALASGAILTVEAGLGLNSGGTSSVAIDDFKVAFADGGASSGMTLTPSSKQYITEHYGRTAWVVDTK